MKANELQAWAKSERARQLLANAKTGYIHQKADTMSKAVAVSSAAPSDFVPYLVSHACSFTVILFGVPCSIPLLWL